MIDRKEKFLKIGFWGLLTLLWAICAYFMLSNAWWIIGDEAIVVNYVGMGKPFLPTGFPDMIPDGRLYPFAYNLYDVLLLFNGTYNTPQSVYILHSIALAIFIFFVGLIGIHILRKKQAIWKYSITFCIAAIAVVRVLPEFITCYTGVWIIYLFLPIFIYCAIRFDETEHWGYGVVALITINYISYCYETICTIPFAIGVCSLLFNYKNLSRNKKIFNILLIAGVVLFLGIWIFVVLPQVTHFYSHQEESSMLMNAMRMFIAQKIYWLAAIALMFRAYQVLFKKRSYNFYDSLLLASFAYFIGSAVLKLNFTYYYTIGALVAMVSFLYYTKEYLKPYWVLAIFVILTMLYGRKYPTIINNAQADRIKSKSQITQLAELSTEMPIYWYAPYYKDQTAHLADVRNSQRERVETILHWYMQNNDIKLIEEENFDSTLKGVWLIPEENEKLFTDYELPIECENKFFDTRGIIGYIVE